MSIRDWLIVVGVVILLGVIADLVRRFVQRGKLRLSIDKKFSGLPDIDMGAELPNGGARVVSGDSHDREPTLTETPIRSAASGQQRTVESEAKKRVIVDDALMTSPASTGEYDESKGWDVDPLLGSDRSSDTEVDLLLEREFKGVGQGADRWAEPTVSSQHESRGLEAEPSVEPPTMAKAIAQDNKSSAGDEVTAFDSTDTLADTLAELSVIEPDSVAVETPIQEPIEPSTQKVVAQNPTVDSVVMGGKDDSASISLVADEVLDLERPVHELLVRQQTATSAATDVDLSDVNPAADKMAQPVPSPDHTKSIKKTPAVEKPVSAKPAKTTKTASRKRAEPRAEEQPTFFDLHPDLAPEVETPAAKPKSRRRRKKVKPSEPNTAPPPEAAVEPQVLIINVQAKRQPFAGPVLFKLVTACGLEFGSEMGIYHRYEGDDGQGALQFSMANAIAPGTFDLNNADQFSTPAITFFLQLADPTDRMNAFECMLATAQCVADNLHGELKDENRSSLRTQTIEHYRQKVREYERKQLTRRV
ncbi:MAG: cell division protein ZipA [Motiliproteus sp.]